MDSPTEEEKAKKRERTAAEGILIGTIIVFTLCLILGFLDRTNQLDIILDYLNFP